MSIYWPNKITYGDLLNDAAEKWSEREAIVFYDKRYKYKEVKQVTDQLAKGLIKIGVKPGDKISLWLNNSPEWIFLFFAAAKIGAVIIPVNTRFKEKELTYVIRQSDSSFVILGKPFRNTNYYEILKNVLPEVGKTQNEHINSSTFPNLKKVISVGEHYEGTISYDELIQLGENINNETLYVREKQVDPDDLFNIIYTSGTTGFPKGVMHSHKMIANMRNVAARLEMNEQDKIILFLPLFHVFASLSGVTAGFASGSCLVLMEAFDPGETLKVIDHEKITLLYAFETMYIDMMNHPNFHKYSRASLRSGISPVPAHIAKDVIKHFCKIANAYGMTETTGVTSLSLYEDPVEKVIHTNGYPMPDTSVKVIDPVTGEELPRGEKGEICVKGHSVMLGYYNKPKETEEVLDKNGWLRSGDLGYMDEEGYLHIEGRIKDMIRVGGENVDPVEVEALLLEHPSVLHAFVVVAPDIRLGEICYAFIQLKEGKQATEQELINYCKNKVASFKIPRFVSFLEDIPLTPTGKIQKFKLRQLAKDLVKN